ncbi:LysR substrate-binding domain-containing protein [Bosea sp. 685]|uniref:LysR substrate-binding domain-containing protein n=1 Tax=Bosea sp. 685 TaxID=3080057 RepID=UPI002892A16B|nr:LysR substrate-binding domain-containing protein [Bosea sp. 685]WNJ90535.1 LysR substrate-binding domain-containing protein [Bosea sp. 685]
MQIPFRSIIVFHAVARAGSVSRAAEELRVTPSAVSQQIQALELHLGTALTLKVGRNITLTEAGERYFQMVGREIEHIADVTQHVRGIRSATTLTVRAAPSVSSKWLLPRLHSFVDANPDIELRLDGTNEPTDFSKENVDIEIRHGEGVWPGLFIEGLGRERFFPLCSPSLLPPASLKAADLPEQRLIHSVKSQMQWPRWFAEAGVEPGRRWHRVLFDRSHMAIDAAASGMGIALESELLAWRELADGTLIRPVRDAPEVMVATQWIVCPHNHLRHRKTRTFLDWLRVERDRSQVQHTEAATV